MMKSQVTSPLLSIFLPLLFSSIFPWAAPSTHNQTHQDFLHCLTLHTNSHSTSISKVIYTQSDSSYTTILKLNLNSPRFDTPSTPKPLFIVTPVDESQIQTVIHCSMKHGIQMRIRGGGHDFEGLSYVCKAPFVMLDLINMRSISVDVATKTAWVQAGATLGELYYKISEKSNTLAFPGGAWSTVGISGLISGGGYGALLRKYGLAADNVIDVRMINQNGQILDKRSMGEDLFWAIRGGGASSFGVIVGWKIQLVDVPEIVTMFTINRTLEENATSLFHKWQYVAPNINRDLFLRVLLRSEYLGNSSKPTLRLFFQASFQGRIHSLIPLMQKAFPELGLTKEACTEMRWIQSALIFSELSYKDPPEIFLNRTAPPRFDIKAKSDYVQKPIPMKGLETIWRRLLKIDVGSPNFVFTPYGGKMNEFSDSALPFPHRGGNLYQLLQGVNLDEAKPEICTRRRSWLVDYYSYMERYVSKSPRRAYFNYNDLDIGVGNKNYEEANIWGRRYFGNNFKRLVQVKNKVDPDNFFRHPQSIPPVVVTTY